MAGLIDTSIIRPELSNALAAGYQQAEDRRNLLAQQQQQRQLADLQLQNALREQRLAGEEEAAWKTGAGNPQAVLKQLQERGLGKQAMALQAQIDKSQADRVTMMKNATELMKSAANSVFTNPTLENAVGTVQAFGQRTGMDVSRDLQELQRLGNNPDAIKQWAAGHAISADKLLPKFQEFSTPGGGKQIGTVNPLTAGFTATTTMAPQLTPYESARIGQENRRLEQDARGVVYQEDANGNIIALPSKLKAGELPTARVAVAPGGGFQPLKAKPSEAVGKEQMSLNQQKSIVQGAIDAVTATPDAFGWFIGNTPEATRARIASPEENQNRAFVFNVVSGVIKERAGTAQSAAEAETLRRFLPVESDDDKIITAKLKGFQDYLAAKEAGTTKKRTPPEKPLSQMDQQALEWANANPSDPRAAQIKQRLGR